MEKTRNYIYSIIFLLTLFIPNFTALAQSHRPIVADIYAYPSSTNTINISWSLPSKTSERTITKLLIYKDTRPIQTPNDLNNLTPLATLPFGSVSYTDTVSDFKNYFYAVISITIPGNFSIDEELYYDEELDVPDSQGEETPYLVILPGVNSTITGTAVKHQKNNSIPIQEDSIESAEKDEINTGMRNQPLPYIDILGEGIPETKKIEGKTSDKAMTLISPSVKKQNVTILEPYIFEDDLISPAGGDEWLLFEILRTSFIKNDYTNCLKALKAFLAQNRTIEVSIRAKFYEGECLYYLGRYQEALNLFLELAEDLPILSRKWSESTLDCYTIR